MITSQALRRYLKWFLKPLYLITWLQGSEQVELITGGTDIEVTAQNVHDYVRRYAEYRMVKVAEKSLKVGIVHWFHLCISCALGCKMINFMLLKLFKSLVTSLRKQPCHWLKLPLRSKPTNQGLVFLDWFPFWIF